MSLDAEQLREVYLFSAFDDAQLTRVLGNTRQIHLAEGERLFDHGQPAENFYWVKQGQIKLFRVSLEGDEKVIELVLPGQTFAEAVMFMERQDYPVSAEAVLDTELLAFDARSMVDILSQSTECCFALLATMSMRLRKQINEIDKLTLHSATFRLVSYLLQQVPDGVLESPQVQLTTPKNVIASRLSIKPETFSRIMSRLQRQGLVDVTGNQIVLHNLSGLRALVEV